MRLAAGTPLAAAAPWHRPRGLGLLGGLATLAIGPRRLALAVGRRERPPASHPGAGRTRAPGGAGELHCLHRAAGLRGDADLMALIAEADGLLARESGGSTVSPELRERLASVAAAARLSAQAGTTVSLTPSPASPRPSPPEPQTRAWLERSALEAGGLRARSPAPPRTASPDRARPSGQPWPRPGSARRRPPGPSRGPSPRSRSRPKPRAAAPLVGLAGRASGHAPGVASNRRLPPRSPAAAERSLKRLERDLQDTADCCWAHPAACARAISTRRPNRSVRRWPAPAPRAKTSSSPGPSSGS